MAPEDIQRARTLFAAWIRWYMDWHAEEVPSEAAMARELGISRSALHYLLEKGSTRSPSFETLLAAKGVLGMSIDAMLTTPPPAARPPRP